MDSIAPVFFLYHFVFENAQEVLFEVKLNPETLEYIPPHDQKKPDWTRLDFQPCGHCGARCEELVYCPIAVNTAHVIEAFKNVESYRITDISVETRERTYSKKGISTQQALSSLLGIFMVTSGCEALDKLRPMVKYHLPFATVEETIYRTASMYLLAQFFQKRHGKEPDWDLSELTDVYQKISEVNVNICERLKRSAVQDASMNAVVILDVFAEMISISLEEELDHLEHLFLDYLQEDTLGDFYGYK